MGVKSTRPPPRRSTTPRAIPRVDAHSSSPPKLYDEEIEGTETDQTAIIAPKSFRTARRPTLMAMAGNHAGNIFRIDKEAVSIGRAGTADITLSDQGVSRIHCVVTRDGAGRYFVEDRGSTNGTIVNGGQVTRAELSAGDRIQLGSEAVLQFGWFDEAEEELAKRMYDGATRDPLTRAFNRRHFYERLASEVSYATRHAEKLSAVLFDIDHFKKINDTLGHAGGDAVLREVGALVGALLRSEDIFARYGGEEFVVLARGLPLKHGMKLAERLRTAIEAHPFMFDGKRVKVTISLGVAELSEAKDARPGERLLMLADGRLYKAKANGRNQSVSK